jgi:hypothetical protein
MKTKLTELAKKLKIDWAEAEKIRDTKLELYEWTGKGKNTWLTPEGATKFELAVNVPPVVPERLTAFVVSDALNERIVWGLIEGVEGRVPVFIPRRLRGNLIGKKIPVHAIQDRSGITYRHASLTGQYH